MGRTCTVTRVGERTGREHPQQLLAGKRMALGIGAKQWDNPAGAPGWVCTTASWYICSSPPPCPSIAMCWQTFPFLSFTDFSAHRGVEEMLWGRTEVSVGCCLQPGLECRVVRILTSPSVSAAGNEVGFLQICASHSADLGVKEGVSSDLSFSCGWSISKGFLSCEFFDALIKCDLAPKPFPPSGYLSGFSPLHGCLFP